LVLSFLAGYIGEQVPAAPGAPPPGQFDPGYSLVGPLAMANARSCGFQLASTNRPADGFDMHLEEFRNFVQGVDLLVFHVRFALLSLLRQLYHRQASVSMGSKYKQSKKLSGYPP
jgi:hypothetical protein